MVPVHVKVDVPGFVGNRMQHALKARPSLWSPRYLQAETVDLVVRHGFGRRLGLVGPLEQADLGGTDLTLAIHEVLMPDIDSTATPHPYLVAMVQRGDLGAKTGRGFFKWHRATPAPTRRDQSRTRGAVAGHLDVRGRRTTRRRSTRIMSVREGTDEFDVVVVGAGILGLAVARELRHRFPSISMVVVERESDVAQHQTGHNSGVIHSGVYYTPGSLKARLCVEGSKLMYEFCEANDIVYERCGKLIVALSDAELPGLDELERRGRANQVSGLRRLRADEITQVEPGCRGVAALHCPDTGIVDYHKVSSALASGLRAQGVEIRFQTTVTSLTRHGSATRVNTSGATLGASFVVGCAGLWSDRLAVSSGAPDDPRIVPFRGAYLTLNKSSTPIVNGSGVSGTEFRIAIPGCSRHQVDQRRCRLGPDRNDGSGA